MKMPHVGLRLKKLVLDSIGIIESLCMEELNDGSALSKYAGVPAEIRLRLEGPALHLSISCLHLAMVELLSIILDRCDSGIQANQSLTGPIYIYACAAQS